MTSRRLARGLSICGAVLLGAMLPAVASAKDYPVPPGSGQAFADALAQAQGNPGPDRILLGAGYYTAPDPNGFNYSSLSDPVEIAGTRAGGARRHHHQRAQRGLSRRCSSAAASGSSIHDVRVELPIGTPAGGIGLQTSGTARHITVFAKDTQQSNSHTGVVLNGGTLEDSIVDVGMKLSAGAQPGRWPGAVHGPRLGRHRQHTRGQQLRRVDRAVAADRRRLGLQAWRNLTTVRSSTIETQLPHARGVYEYTSPGYDTNVVLDGVDMIGPGGADTRGVWTSTLAQGTKATATVRNSILRGFIASLVAEGGSKVDASYSDYDGSGNLTQGGEITESSISNVGAAGFAGPGRLPPDAGVAARRRGRSRHCAGTRPRRQPARGGRQRRRHRAPRHRSLRAARPGPAAAGGWRPGRGHHGPGPVRLRQHEKVVREADALPLHAQRGRAGDDHDPARDRHGHPDAVPHGRRDHADRRRPAGTAPPSRARSAAGCCAPGGTARSHAPPTPRATGRRPGARRSASPASRALGYAGHT